MNPKYIRELIIRHVRQDAMTLQEAARNVLKNLGTTTQVQSIIRGVIKDIHDELKNNTVFGPGELGSNEVPWYTGVEAGDRFWPAYRERLLHGAMADAVSEIDKTSHTIVSKLADPRTPGSKKKGLVLGYVQSGKTANYTAVMSKAADAGYQLFIVLAGMHNNLRRQTQVRLESDLFGDDWYTLTTPIADFSKMAKGAALMKKHVHMAGVVKKQRHRLSALRDWLREIPLDIRTKCPVLLLDDEADQATPNTKAEREELSRINQLIREIWAEIPTGTYVGYTATPFANVFMNPNDKEDLYPSNFILSLPRPETYFGAERLFGRPGFDTDDEAETGLDVIRYIPQEDADQLRPPSKKEERANFSAAVPESLRDAVLWFLVATAIRRARGQMDQHSSMLIHTTHYTGPHFAMRDELAPLLNTLQSEVIKDGFKAFEEAWAREQDRASEVATEALPSWDEVKKWLPSVLEACRIVVDNSESFDRLDYERKDAQGNPITETVIVVGGGTLSRGLTLEGLVVSYFLRTSNTYDTLLQMGRWFGYRPGYEDLPRIWMPMDLKDDFEFLALVESEIREEIQQLIEMGLTPGELGVRVRAHPGRLAITAQNKLVHAEEASLSFTGKRVQTFILDKKAEVIEQNQKATRDLLAHVEKYAGKVPTASAEWLALDVPAADIVEYFREYKIHPKQHDMQNDFITQWMERFALHTQWNIAVMGRKPDGHTDKLGDLDLGLPRKVPAVNRAPLKSSAPGEANIKALLSRADWVADLPKDVIASTSATDPAGYRKLRQECAGGNGLLIIYVISGNSHPFYGSEKRPSVRQDMNVDGQLIGVGIVFPGYDQITDEGDGKYLVVHPDWEVEDGDQEELPQDNEDEIEPNTLPQGWEWLENES